MRVNIYHHEVPERIEPVQTEADTGLVYHGVRFYTEPPLMHQPGDDDSSAVTFWVPWTKLNGHDTSSLRQVFKQALAALDHIDQIKEA